MTRAILWGRIGRPLVTLAMLLTAWQGIVLATGVPRYILPAPPEVLTAILNHADRLLYHAGWTASEIILGLLLGLCLGVATALLMAAWRPFQRWLMPVLVSSQAVPVFALAPILVLWLGYGLASKVAMATLIIYFPVTSAFFDGLRRTDPGWIDLARTLGGSPWAILWQVRIPAALPGLASGIRVATAVAPIGAVVGEWVGASAGLGYLMLHANGRMQTDLMFAALLVLAVMAVGLYTLVDRLLTLAIPWQTDHTPSTSGALR